MADRITDEQETDALRVLRQSYYESVRDIAEEAAAIDGFAGMGETRDIFIDESVDGSEWVIYTWRARLVRSLSEHDDAYEEAYGDYVHDLFGAAGDTLDSGITRAAFLAMREDVIAMVAQLDKAA